MVREYRRYLLTALCVLPMLVVAMTGCEVRKTQEGNLPKIDVDAEGGQLPKYDVDVKKTQEGEMPGVDVDVTEKGQMPGYSVKPAEVEIGTKDKQITVPDIDVNKKEVTVPVPDIDIKSSDESNTNSTPSS